MRELTILSPQETAVSEAAALAQQSKVDKAPAPLLDVLQANLSERLLKDIEPVFREAGAVKQNGNHVSISRDKVTHIPLGGEFLNGNIKATVLEVGSVSFDFDRQRQSASNIQGISLKLDLFGSDHSFALRKLELRKDDNGGKVLRIDLETPLPKPAERIIGMPPTFFVDVPIEANRLGTPKLSQVFADMAASNGTSIAGLLASDALNEASKAALFTESNPEWINTILQPVLHEIYKAFQPPAEEGEAADPGNPPEAPKAPELAVVKALTADVPSQPGDHEYKMTIAGVERTYRVHVPPSYNSKTPMPLVVVLHGHAQNGSEIARHTGLSQLADKKGFIAVYPDARKWAGREEWRAWDSGNGLLPPGAKADDVNFLRKIIEKTEQDLLIDGKRIYMAGLSNGGMMTFKAAGELSDRLAAVAVISSAMSGSEPPPKHPLSVLNVHGTRDTIIPYEGLKDVPASLTAIGLPRFQSTGYATNYWVEQNRIATPPLVLRNENVTQRRFIDTQAGLEVNEYTIYGGEHVPDRIGELTETVWQFFDAHPKVRGATSGKLQPSLEEPFNITERIKAHARTRGISGIQIDIGKMLNEVPQIGDGSFSPANSIHEFERRSGILLEDSVSSFFKQTDRISKDQQRLSIELKKPWNVQLDETAGPFALKSITVNSPSFDLQSENGAPALRNVTGISFDLRALGTNFDVKVTDAAQRIDSAQEPFYELKVRNPMPGPVRFLFFASSEIPINLKFDDNARPYVLNQRQLKDAALGVNPVTRGYIDLGTHVHDLFTQPSWGNGLHVVKDLSLSAGAAWGGYRLVALRYGTRARIGGAVGFGLLVAPAVIHGIERLIR